MDELEQELFDMERERPFEVHEDVLVDTVVGRTKATVMRLGRSRDGFPIAEVRPRAGGGIYTVSLSRLHHQED